MKQSDLGVSQNQGAPSTDPVISRTSKKKTPNFWKQPFQISYNARLPPTPGAQAERWSLGLDLLDQLEGCGATPRLGSRRCLQVSLRPKAWAPGLYMADSVSN